MLTIMFPVVDDLLYEKEKKELCTNAYLFQSRVLSCLKSCEARTTYLLVSYTIRTLDYLIIVIKGNS